MLECNSQLHIYYPNAYPKSCTRCGFHSDTVSHVLNGCRDSKCAIQARHNRVLDIISNAVSALVCLAETTILKDQPIRPTHFDDTEIESVFEGIHSNRPDLSVINHRERSCSIIEIAVPYDPFINDCYQLKFDKYLPLSQKISDLGYSCKIIVLIVGSLGSVHSRFASGLKLAGFCNARAKAIARYCSVSAMIGSRIIWKQRCKAVLP